jgi:hypothetical protein
MFPPAGAADDPLVPADAFDVPVFVRHSFPFDAAGRPVPGRVRRSSAPWPQRGRIPATGDYLVTTTWRDVLHAALEVGRDVTPWLSHIPQLARMEIIARQSPLRAYLRRVVHPHPTVAGTHSTGHIVVANDVYNHGTEITARGAFSYRIGMTMTEWICRGWLGLGPTIHAESAVPPGADPVSWAALAGKPDLFGLHSRHPRTWLVEAKAARRLHKSKLTKGAQQLIAGGQAHGGAHTKVLCGASLEDQLFVTLDFESMDEVIGEDPLVAEEPDVADDDGALYAVARSSMLIYLFLRSAQHQTLRIAPVSMNGASSRGIPGTSRRGGGLSALEYDVRTRVIRGRLADVGSSELLTELVRRGEAVDLLTAAVPGTDIAIGLSRRVFGACQALAGELRTIAETAERSLDLPTSSRPGRHPALPDDEFEEVRLERLRRFREIENDRRQRLYDVARRGFEDVETQTWSSLMDVGPNSRVPDTPAQLEGATQDTYFAIDAASAAAQ